MRATCVVLALLISASHQLFSQTTATASDSIERQIEALRGDPHAGTVPPADSFTRGPRIVGAADTVRGPVAVAGGDLDVAGTIIGDAYVVGGDVILRPGGHVTGSAFSAFGSVQMRGGRVDGEMRMLGGIVGPVVRTLADEPTPIGATRHAVSLALGWMIVLTLIGIGVLVFANSYLDGVVEALEGNFSKSLWVGLAAQLALVPALVVMIIGLALTIIGLLLIPFATVAFTLAVAGLVTLGFLAVARVTGDALARGAARRLTVRGGELRALIVGVALFMGLWVLAAAFTWAPVVGAVLRALALGVTWVAATAGLGAAVLSRGGTRREADEVSPEPLAPELAWQTPTPISGVVAARRPTSTTTGRR
jgi:hypothetical protein